MVMGANFFRIRRVAKRFNDTLERSNRRRSGETSYLHFVKTATIPMVPYATTLNFHDISNVHVQNMLCAMRDSRLATFFKHLLHRRNTTRGNHGFEEPVLNKIGECRVSIIIELGQTCGDSEDTKAALLTCLRKPTSLSLEKKKFIPTTTDHVLSYARTAGNGVHFFDLEGYHRRPPAERGLSWKLGCMQASGCPGHLEEGLEVNISSEKMSDSGLALLAIHLPAYTRPGLQQVLHSNRAEPLKTFEPSA
ncbi:unnamed protein product [Nesidiocoris tenuis]|uniref:Uncharacterized protein n=1 Tax=Nesidiocoris tenuis TaxID=355587 RepID=A0A6H5HBM0_9HEMI|nr:unnamed protein product [Nesidiocoris tenuis]